MLRPRLSGALEVCLWSAVILYGLYRWLGVTSFASPFHAICTTTSTRINILEDAFQKEVALRPRTVRRFPDPNKIEFFPDSGGVLIWDLFYPSYSCPWEFTRIGQLGDGGKWVCGIHKFKALPSPKKTIVYSLGVERDSTFEEALMGQIDVELFAYDPTVEGFGPQLSEQFRKQAHFKKVAIGGKTDRSMKDNNWEVWSLKDLMKENGHEWIDILKIDIEGWEYETLYNFIDDWGGNFPVGQMLIEVHIFPDRFPHTGNQMMAWWEKLESAGMRASWIELNYLSLRYYDRHPRFAEFVFINGKDPRNLLLHD